MTASDLSEGSSPGRIVAVAVAVADWLRRNEEGDGNRSFEVVVREIEVDELFRFVLR